MVGVLGASPARVRHALVDAAEDEHGVGVVRGVLVVRWGQVRGAQGACVYLGGSGRIRRKSINQGKFEGVF